MDEIVLRRPSEGVIRVKNVCGQRGLSFLELLISITILMIAIGSVLVAVNFAAKVSRHNINKTIAMNLAMQRMEQINKDSYANVIPANYPPEAGIAVAANPVRFDRAVNIQIGNYKTVTVTVTWNQLGAPFVETESITTLIGEQ